MTDDEKAQRREAGKQRRLKTQIMVPSPANLALRDLVPAAMKIATGHGLTIVDMFMERKAPAPKARAAFYWHLRGIGWSDASIGRFVGRQHKSVGDAMRKYPEVQDGSEGRKRAGVGGGAEKAASGAHVLASGGEQS